jgi:hypothetical protein
MTTVWVLVIVIYGKGYVGNIDNISSEQECLKTREAIMTNKVYEPSFCIKVIKKLS